MNKIKIKSREHEIDGYYLYKAAEKHAEMNEGLTVGEEFSNFIADRISHQLTEMFMMYSRKLSQEIKKCKKDMNPEHNEIVKIATLELSLEFKSWDYAFILETKETEDFGFVGFLKNIFYKHTDN